MTWCILFTRLVISQYGCVIEWLAASGLANFAGAFCLCKHMLAHRAAVVCQSSVASEDGVVFCNYECYVRFSYI
jgi:hypothetical protein